MKKSMIILLSIILFSCQQQNKSVESQQTEQPNIVLIIGDDHGYPYFGFMGADYVQTPNMDALAASGILFPNGYVSSNYCRPSLKTLITGKHPITYRLEVERLLTKEKADQNIIERPIEEQREWERDFRFHAMKYFETLPKLLAQKGYASFQGGKWWEFNYQNGGFSEGMTKGWTKEEQNQPDWFQKFMGGDGTELGRTTMQPVYDFIDTHPDRPFFLWFAPELPHYPFDAPDEYYNLYKDQDMTESAKRYYANCTWFDDGVGKLMKYLKEKDLYENTLFIYVNDNGWEQNPDQEFRHDSLRWHNGGDKGKLSVYDQSFRTPIIFSWENHIEKGSKRNDLIYSADIPATILDYLDIAIPDDYAGLSYRTVISGEKTNQRTEIIGDVEQIRWEGDMMGRNIEGYWIRTEGWFFKWNVTTKEKALFDMKKDPNNDQDLSEDHPDLVEKYTNRILNWKEEMRKL